MQNALTNAKDIPPAFRALPDQISNSLRFHIRPIGGHTDQIPVAVGIIDTVHRGSRTSSPSDTEQDTPLPLWCRHVQSLTITSARYEVHSSARCHLHQPLPSSSARISSRIDNIASQKRSSSSRLSLSVAHHQGTCNRERHRRCMEA